MERGRERVQISWYSRDKLVRLILRSDHSFELSIQQAMTQLIAIWGGGGGGDYLLGKDTGKDLVKGYLLSCENSPVD